MKSMGHRSWDGDTKATQVMFKQAGLESSSLTSVSTYNYVAGINYCVSIGYFLRKKKSIYDAGGDSVSGQRYVNDA